jgi:hypothetical protein
MAQSQQPVALAVVTAMAFNFMPVLAPTNQMSYDTAQFYNSTLAIFVGCAAAPLSFRLLPPLSPELRARRLLALTLRDLRRLANGQLALQIEDWQGRVYARIAALPDQAEPLQRARLLAALSVGSEIVQLRLVSPLLCLVPELNAVLSLWACQCGGPIVAPWVRCPAGDQKGSSTHGRPSERLFPGRQLADLPRLRSRNPLSWHSPRGMYWWIQKRTTKSVSTD